MNRVRRAGIDRVVYGGLTALCVAVLIVPAAMTTFGLGVKPGGPAGIRLTANGLADKVTYGGEIAAVDGMCAAIAAATRRWCSSRAVRAGSPTG